MIKSNLGTQIYPSSSTQAGFTLIEALVAIVVLAIGMLGLSFLQAQGLTFNNSAYARSQSTIAAYDIIDKMRINPIAALNGAYDASTAPSSFTDCDVSNCDTAEMANFDLAQWYQQMQQDFGGDGQIVFTAPNTYTITMQWMERRRVRDKQNQDPNELVMQARTQVWEVQI